MPDIKTNVMRILEKKKVSFSAHTYPHGDEAVDGATVAELTGQDPAQVFKTLITQGASKQYYVFVIPVLCELVVFCLYRIRLNDFRGPEHLG